MAQQWWRQWFGVKKTASLCRGPAKWFHPRVIRLEDRNLPSGGLLDPAFGTNGQVATDFSAQATTSAFVTGMVVQPDGKVIVIGRASQGASSDFALVRYNADGGLDGTFGTGGKVTTDMRIAPQAQPSDDYAQCVVLQPNGDILVGGYTDTTGNQDYAYAVARYDPSGNLDPTFGSGGKVVGQFFPFAPFSSIGQALAVLPNGQILVAGYKPSDSSGFESFLFARLNANGSLDQSYGSGGTLSFRFGQLAVSSTHEVPTAMVVQPDGKILVGGYADDRVSNDDDFVLFRLLPNGNGLDGSFGNGPSAGMSITDFGSRVDQAYGLALQPDGKILLAGKAKVGTAQDFALARYQANGQLDTTFGSGGKLVANLGGIFAGAQGVTVQSDGKILVGGDTSFVQPGTEHIVLRGGLARFNANGSLDSKFGQNGVANFNAPIAAVALVPDGSAVMVAGDQPSSQSNEVFVVARYTTVNIPPSNVVLSLDANAINEGDTVALHGTFTDLEPNQAHTVTLDWGDGQGSQQLSLAAGLRSFDVSHRYLDNPAGQRTGPYSVVVTVSDDEGGSSPPASITVTVSNVAPGVTAPGSQQTTVLGVSTLFDLGSFTDPGTDSPWGVVVDWGDNSSDHFSVNNPGSLGQRQHTYASGGTFPVRVSVTDKDGDLGSSTFDVRSLEAPSLQVTTLQDVVDPFDGQTSLREAVAYANSHSGADTVSFAPTLTAGGDATITLTAGQLSLTDTTGLTTIQGPGAGLLTIDGNNTGRVFLIDSGVTAILDELAIAHGQVTNYDLGGGIYNSGTLTVSNSTLSDNSAPGGGGIANSGTLTVSNSIFSGNSATHSGGGGIYNSGMLTVSGTLTVSNSTLSGNFAPQGLGGGISNVLGTLTVSNSTLWGNSAAGGGGIDNFGTLTVSNSTLSGNSALSQILNDNSGGLANFFGTARLGNTIIAGNTFSGSYGGPDLGGALTSLGHNLIGIGDKSSGLANGVNGDLVGTGEAPLNPLLAPLGDYGGPTQTMALLPGSPALDAGSNALIPSTGGVTTEGLVSLYSMDGSANDAVGGNNPSAVNAINFVPGQVGQGAQFDPAAGSFIDIPDTPALDNQQFTLMAWARPDGPGYNNDYYGSPIVTKDRAGVSGTTGLWWSAQVNQFGFPFSIDNQIRFITSTDTFGPGQFYLVAGTYDGTTFRLYVNGALEAEQVMPATLLYDASIPWTIGSESLPYRNINYPRTWNGVIDDVRIYNRALNAAEIQAAYAGMHSDATDQRGFARVAGTQVDIGAFERQPGMLLVNTTADGPGIAPGHLSLRQAVALANVTPGPDIIGFDPTLTVGGPATITLTAGQLSLTDTRGSTTIQGPGADLLTIDGNNASRVFVIDSGVSATLDGLTIANGKAPEGGGISNSGTLTVSNSTFTGNSASFGGGVFNDGPLTVSNSIFTGNRASNSNYAGGGGIFNYNYGTVTVSNSTFTGNSASYFGGGILNDNTLTVTNSTLTDNSGYNGGGIWNYASATLTVSNSTLADNSASNGGGIFNYYGTVTVSNSTLAGNSANSTLPVNSGTFSGNTVGTGGGIYNDNTLMVSNSTLSGNSASCGGGIFNSDGTAKLGNTIVAGNMLASGGSGPDVNGGFTSLGHNLIGVGDGSTGLTNGVNGDLVGTGVAPVDPLLAPLGNYGGPTQTMALLSGSPALDAGSNALIPIDPATGSPYTTDQRGRARIVGSAVDIGAFEVQAVTWVNPAGGDWDDASNWLDDQGVHRLPSADDIAIIDLPGQNAFTVTHDAATLDAVSKLISQDALVISGGSLSVAAASSFTSDLTLSNFATLTGTGDMTVSGLFTWNGGTLSGPAGSKLTVQGGMQLVGGFTPEILDGRTLDNAPGSTATWISPAAHPDQAQVLVDNNATFVNEAGATFDAQVDDLYGGVFGGQGTFVNAGRLKRTAGSGDASFHLAFQLQAGGVVEAQAAGLGLGAAGSTSTYSGTLTADAGARLIFFGGTHEFDSGSVIQGSGQIVFGINEDGTYTVGGSYDVTGTTQLGSGGHSADVSFTRTVNHLGTLQIGSGSVLDLSAATLAPAAAALLEVAGDLGGSLVDSTLNTGTQHIQEIRIDGALTATARIKVGYLDTLTVNGDLAGTVYGYGSGGDGTTTFSITNVNVAGNWPGTIVAPTIGYVNQTPANQSPPYFSGQLLETTPGADLRVLNLAGTVTSTAVISASVIQSMQVGQDLAGRISVAGTLGTLTVGGTLSGSVAAANAGSITVGKDQSGQVTVSQVLGSLSVTGNLSGQVTAQTVGSVNVSGTATAGAVQANQIQTLSSGRAYGPVVLRLTQGGVERRLEASVVGAASIQNVVFGYSYDATGPGDPRLTVHVLANPDHVLFDLGLFSSSAAAKFNLARLDGPSGQAAGVRDITVDGDLLAGAIQLPRDALGDVAARDNASAGAIQAASVQAVAFGTLVKKDGHTATATAAQAGDAAQLLAPGTALAPASTTFRLDFGEAQPVAFFLDTRGNQFDALSTLFTDQVKDGVAVRAQVTASAGGGSSTIQTIALSGAGGSIQTRQLIATAITSTGPLGDLILGAAQGIVASITAPSIGGIDATSGPISSTIQTTTGDLGRVLTDTSGKVVGTTVLHAAGDISGKIISRGNLVSQVIADGGISGVIAAQGDIGVRVGSTRWGGIVANAGIRGQVVTLGYLVGDVTINGGLKGGRLAARGGIVGNVTVSGGLDSASAIVSDGAMGDSAAGTVLTVNGDNKGILAARSSIRFGKQAPKGSVYDNVGATPGSRNAAAIDALFTDHSQLLAFDRSGLDLGGLTLILADLAALKIGADGNLTGPVA